MLPVDDIEAEKIVQELLKRPPEIGYLTISNALQWRLQYGRVMGDAGASRRHNSSTLAVMVVNRNKNGVPSLEISRLLWYSPGEYAACSPGEM